jgi:hypothetical protein
MQLLVKQRTFSQLETLQLMAACSLSTTDFANAPPQIYTEMKSEGRTIERILTQALAPDPNSEHPIRVFVSRDLIADVKDLMYGFNNSLEYSSRHSGISPFAFSPLTAEQALSSRHQ